MDSRNNEGAAIAMVLGVIVVMIQIVAAVVAAIAICLTAFLSIVALVTLLRGGLTLNGEYISPRDARMFFVRGVIGAVAVPVFLAPVFAILGWEITAPLEWVVFGGFAFGSTGFEIMEAYEEEEKAKAAAMTVLPPLPEYDHYAPPVVPTIELREPFRFANWEDEEHGR